MDELKNLIISFKDNKFEGETLCLKPKDTDVVKYILKPYFFKDTDLFLLAFFEYDKVKRDKHKFEEIDNTSCGSCDMFKMKKEIVMEVIGGAFEKSADFNFSFEYEMRRRDAKILQVLVDLYISYDDEGQPDKSYGTKYDLTKRKKYEETLKIAKENAELINKLNIEKLKTQDNLLIQQSRHAARGEMIGNIAHQWRQPLNALGLTIQKIKMFHAEGILSDEKLDKSVQKSKMLINKMSNTIDDFRNFFRTKEQRKGTGIGLYMSKMIIETNLNGKLSVQNYKDGAKFILKLSGE